MHAFRINSEIRHFALYGLYILKQIFECVPNRTTVFTREYLCHCKERLKPKFLSCLEELQEVDIDETERRRSKLDSKYKIS